MGRVMGALVPRTRGRADGKIVSDLVNAELARLEAEAEVESAAAAGKPER
jgi:hypothetical protein